MKIRTQPFCKNFTGSLSHIETSRVKCIISQSRSFAMRKRSLSGLTATGNPTHSKSGTSVMESL